MNLTPFGKDRKARFDQDCEDLEDLFFNCMQTSARARIKWIKRMNQRALESEDMCSTAWMLERSEPEHYSLVTTNRREVDIKVEITHKHEAELLAEAFAILGPATPQLPAGQGTITLPEGHAVPVDPDHH